LDTALQEILLVYRDISYLQAGGDTQKVINLPMLAEIQMYAKSMTKHEVIIKLDKISEARHRLLETNVAQQLLLEAMFMGLLIPKRALN
jgi:hypothetical protein